MSFLVPMSRKDAAHLLRRAGFGTTPAELAAWSALGRDEAIDRLCDTSGAPLPAAPALVHDITAESWPRHLAMLHCWFDRMATSPWPLQEKLTLFWHGHFTSSRDAIGDGRLMWDQNQLFRRLGLGDFLELAQAVAKDPAMLLYLNNASNRVGAPNENWARESLELFTLGVNQYTQDDVVAAARAWTGHGLSSLPPGSTAQRTYEFQPKRHDSGLKTFLGTSGFWDGPALLAHAVTGPTRDVHAAFLVTRLWSFFAYPDPEPRVVRALATAYLRSGRNVGATMRALFRRDEFWSARARTSLVRSPTELMVAAMKATGLDASVARPDWWDADMGQRLFYPPNVAGWGRNGYWLSDSAVRRRAEFANHLVWKSRDAGRLPDTRRMQVPEAVQHAFDVFGITEPAPATRAALEAWVRDERANKGWAEQPYLALLTMLTPDFQLA